MSHRPTMAHRPGSSEGAALIALAGIRKSNATTKAAIPLTAFSRIMLFVFPTFFDIGKFTPSFTERAFCLSRLCRIKSRRLKGGSQRWAVSSANEIRVPSVSIMVRLPFSISIIRSLS